MGCQTGFYLTLFGKPDLAEFKDFFKTCLQDMLNAKEIPGVRIEECGNYKSHSLESAKKWALAFLQKDAAIL